MHTLKRHALLTAIYIAGAATLNANTELNWYLRHDDTTTRATLNSVAFGHGKYIAVGYENSMRNIMMQSTDGGTWSEVTPPATTDYLYTIAFGNDTFVLGGALQTHKWYSTDGVNWNTFTSASGSLRRVRFLDGEFYGIHARATIMRSTAGRDWQPFMVDVESRIAISDIAKGGSRYVLAGRNDVGDGLIKYSQNSGHTWQTANLDLYNQLKSVTYGNDRFVAVGGDGAWHGTIVTSSDGANWQVVTTNFNYMLNYVTFEGGLFVIGGDSGTILVSSDGLNWTPQWDEYNPVTIYAIHGLCRANGRFTGVGFRSAIVQSGPAGTRQLPTPAIRANNETGTITVERGTPVALAVTVDAGDYTGQNVDLWAIAVPNYGNKWFYLPPNMQWQGFTTGNLAECLPAFTGPLMNIYPPFTIMPAQPLPPGTYNVYFAVGAMGAPLRYPSDQIIFDQVTVRVEE